MQFSLSIWLEVASGTSAGQLTASLAGRKRGFCPLHRRAALGREEGLAEYRTLLELVAVSAWQSHGCHRDVLAQQGEELAAGDGPAAQALEVARGELTVDDGDAVAATHAHQV